MLELGHITGLLKRIQPAVEAETHEKHNRTSKNPEFVYRVTELNVKFTKEYIYKESPILREMIENNEVQLVGAIYDVQTGEVIFEGGQSRLDMIENEGRAPLGSNGI